MSNRIRKELTAVLANCPAGVTIGLKDSNINEWEAVIQGPADTPYKGGHFPVEFTFPANYPFKAPQIAFKCKIYHPNVDEKGAICMGLLKQDAWKPAIRVVDIIQELILLLRNPNPDDPLDASIAQQFKQDRKEFDKTAADWTKKYASGN